MLKQLTSLGLSDNEAKVYMAMLELGSATVLEISAKAGVNRPTTYVQIESLKKMGLVSSQVKGKKQLFIAESPDQLEFVIEREIKTIEDKKAELARMMPELSGLFNVSGDKPQVRFFEGKEGLIKMQDEMLRSKSKEIVSFSSADGILKHFPTHPKDYSPRRVQKGIRSRLIYTSSGGPILKEHDEKMLREAKFVSPEEFPFKSDIVIYDNNVAISALEGKTVGIIISHRELADSFRALFELVWNSLGGN